MSSHFALAKTRECVAKWNIFATHWVHETVKREKYALGVCRLTIWPDVVWLTFCWNIAALLIYGWNISAGLGRKWFGGGGKFGGKSNDMRRPRRADAFVHMCVPMCTWSNQIEMEFQSMNHTNTPETRDTRELNKPSNFLWSKTISGKCCRWTAWRLYVCACEFVPMNSSWNISYKFCTTISSLLFSHHHLPPHHTQTPFNSPKYLKACRS